MIAPQADPLDKSGFNWLGAGSCRPGLRSPAHVFTVLRSTGVRERRGGEDVRVHRAKSSGRVGSSQWADRLLTRRRGDAREGVWEWQSEKPTVSFRSSGR